jgi:hypothetical protein
MSLFETETMAELCVAQGLTAEALRIYRRLLTETADAETRARRQRRVTELESRAGVPAATTAHATPPATSPTLRVERSGSEARFEWTLPAHTERPALQLLLVRRTATGIETEPRTVGLPGPSGRTTIAVGEIHSLHAALGWLDGERFVPLARVAPSGP